MNQTLEFLFAECVRLKASDVHLSAGLAPVFRVNGALTAIGQPLDAESLAAMARDFLPPAARETLARERHCDLGHSRAEGARFRVNVYHERGRLAFAIRRLEARIQSLAQLNLPASIRELTQLRDGLVLVTGATGSGKSTTLACLIEEINRSESLHILTVEDPIEYVFENRRAIVHQRELYVDVTSFADAVRAALREDPDVILVGEMRDLPTMRAAITAAETGHLVFSTLHTGDAVGAIDRIVGVFPAAEQEQIRLQLSLTLRAVVAQHLLPAANAQGRIPALEILQVTPAVASLIRQSKSRQIYSMMETGRAQGMQTLEQALAELAAAGRVVEGHARLLARDVALFDRALALARSQGTAA